MIAASVGDIAMSGRLEQYNAKTITESDKGNILPSTTTRITVTSSLLKYSQVNIRHKVKGIFKVKGILIVVFRAIVKSKL